MSKIKLIFLFFVFSFYWLLAIQSDTYISLTEVSLELDLDVKIDWDTGKVILKRKDKTANVLINSSYLILDEEVIFIYEFVVLKNGEIFLPIKSYEFLKKYFNNKYYSFKEEVYLDNPKKIEKSSKNRENYANQSLEGVKIKDRYIYNKETSIKINAIIIDAGHGGHDPGAIGPCGTKEKDISLKIALLLKELLKNIFPDKKIVLIRDKDEFVSLEKRSQIANWVFNTYGPSVFLSIHTNASKSPKSYGFETWYLVEEYRRQIVKNGLISTDADVETVLNSMLNDAIYNESKFLARRIQYHLNRRIGFVSMDRGIKEETYFVIKKSIMPAVLVEVGFVTNKEEELRLTNNKYLNNIVYGIIDGLKDFIEVYEGNNAHIR